MPRILICTRTESTRRTLDTILTELELGGTIHPSPSDSCIEAVTSLIPDIIFFEITPTDQGWIDLIGEINRFITSPIILIGSTIDTQTIRKATEAGAAYFVSIPLRKQDLVAAMEIAISHIEHLDSFRDQVSKLKESLETRKIIERAKGVLMQERGVSEAEAYRMMQRTAMDRRISLKEVAERILRR
ncbi:MAG: nitrogen fixation two-component system response regulator GnfR [Desulfuromonadia bacterium]